MVTFIQCKTDTGGYLSNFKTPHANNQPANTRNTGRAAAFVLAMLIAAPVFSLTGCASAPEVQGIRDPKELYDKAMASYLDEKFEDSEKTFKTLMEEHPLSPYASEAQLMLGDVCYALERYEDAASYYTNFAAMHPRHSRAAYAFFQKGMSYFKDILSIDRDQTATKKALFAFQDLTAGYPSSPYAPKANELVVFLKGRLAEREFYVANFYFKNDNYKGALGRLRDILKTYPDAGIADKTLYMIADTYARLGEARLARNAYSTLVTNYPASPLADDARAKLKEG